MNDDTLQRLLRWRFADAESEAPPPPSARALLARSDVSVTPATVAGDDQSRRARPSLLRDAELSADRRAT